MGTFDMTLSVFVETDPGLAQRGMQGMQIACVRLFVSFTLDFKCYPCALIEWFVPSDEPDEDTQMSHRSVTFFCY